MEIATGFPDVLLPAFPTPRTADEAALIADADLVPFWQALADYVPKMTALGWDRFTAIGTLVGSVTVPLAMGYDFQGTLPQRVREGVEMEGRTKAAALARELAKQLDRIAKEPLPPDGLHVLNLVPLPPSVSRNVPSYFALWQTSAALRTLADALITSPDFLEAPGLASQKPSWRAFIREVRANLDDNGFLLRERDAVALVAALARSEGKVTPSRESVAAALRAVNGKPE